MTIDLGAERMRATPGPLEHPAHGARIIAARTGTSGPDAPARSEQDVTAGPGPAPPDILDEWRASHRTIAWLTIHRDCLWSLKRFGPDHRPVEGSALAEHVVGEYARGVWFTTPTPAQAGEEPLGAR